MSKMTKTQLNHLSTRLLAALTTSMGIKFKEKSKPIVTQAAIETEGRKIAKILKLDYQTYSYPIRALAHLCLSRARPEVDEGNKEIQANREAYHKEHLAKINEIIDEAILGDSTEALKALKDFQGSL